MYPEEYRRLVVVNVVVGAADARATTARRASAMRTEAIDARIGRAHV